MPSFVQLPYEVRALIYRELLQGVCVTAEPIVPVRAGETSSPTDSLSLVQGTGLVPRVRKQAGEAGREWLHALFSTRVAHTDKAFAEAMIHAATFNATTSSLVTNLAGNSVLRSVSADQPLLKMRSLYCGPADFLHQGMAMVLSRFLRPTFPSLQEVKLTTEVTAHWFRDDKVVFRPRALPGHFKDRGKDVVYQPRDLGRALVQIVSSRSPLFPRLCDKSGVRVVLEFDLYKSDRDFDDGRLPRVSTDRARFRDELSEASFDITDRILRVSSPRRPDRVLTLPQN